MEPASCRAVARTGKPALIATQHLAGHRAVIDALDAYTAVRLQSHFDYLLTGKIERLLLWYLSRTRLPRVSNEGERIGEGGYGGQAFYLT